jgi:AraC family transcriptional regulator, regulatory protein of adaptative response / methylated-DNA-[protein]-cysteine methyltransferase
VFSGSKTTVTLLTPIPIHLISITTPIGQMIAGAFEDGVCLLEFNETAPEDFDSKSFFQNPDCELSLKPNAHLEKLQTELQNYFEGKLKNFTVSLAPHGTEFQQRVWHLLQTIPYGTLQSYKQQSENLNQPLAIRAMAHANGQNPIAIIIPCHRVIGSNGKLTGYAGGLWRKKWLLEHERVNSPLNGTLF